MANTMVLVNIILMFFISSSSQNNANTEYSWNLVVDYPNMTIYTRKPISSNIKEVLVKGVIEADLESIIQSLNHVQDYPEWIYNCSKSFQFKIKNANDYHYYIKTELPVMFSDRDVVVHTKQWVGKDGFWYSNSVARPYLLPEKKDIVRIKRHESLWKIKAINSSSVKYEYFLSTDPGGALPAWLINLGITQAPLNTITALEKRSIKMMNQKYSR